MGGKGWSGPTPRALPLVLSPSPAPPPPPPPFPVQFDSVFLAALQSKVTGKATFRGRLDTYRFCDGVWTFILTDAVFRLAGGRGRPARDVASKRIKVVAVDARLAKP